MNDTTYKFDTFPQGFDYCREKGHPVQVYVRAGVRWNLYKLYPSGSAKMLAQGPITDPYNTDKQVAQ